MGKTVLVMLSGGIESTYLLYRYLIQTDYIIHAHHITMYHSTELQWQADELACKSIVRECQKIRPFEFSTSRLAFGFSHSVACDRATQLLLASRVLPNLKGETVQVALGRRLDVYSNDPVSAKEDRVETLWLAYHASIDMPYRKRVSKEVVMPLAETAMTKEAMRRELPKALFALTSVDMRPVHGGSRR